MERLLKQSGIYFYTIDQSTSYAPYQHNVPLGDVIHNLQNIKNCLSLSSKIDTIEFSLIDNDQYFHIIYDQEFLIIQNITSNVQDYKALYQDFHKQLQISESKMAFMSRMSHEFRTPLNAVIGFSDAIKHKIYGEIPKPYLEYVHNIHAAGKHLLDVVNDILDVSYQENETHEAQLKISDFSPIFAINNIQKFIHSLLAKQKIIINLVHNLSDDFIITNDAHMFKRVFINIIGNATKYCPPYTHLDIKITNNIKANQLDIHIRDYGNGFPETVISNFGIPFNVGDNLHADTKYSIGLGLCIIKSSIETMGGHIAIGNHSEGGAVFDITVPVNIKILQKFS